MPDFLEAETTYTVRVKAVIQDKESEWSEEAVFVAPKDLWHCGWKECPDNVSKNRRYSVDETNTRIAAKTNPVIADTGIINSNHHGFMLLSSFHCRTP